MIYKFKNEKKFQKALRTNSRSKKNNKKYSSFFNIRENINLFRDYSFLLSEDKYKTKYGEGLKVLTPKQMLQRLPIALAQVKAGNNSEKLLSVIRQIVYSLYQSKDFTKKVYNNIIK